MRGASESLWTYFPEVRRGYGVQLTYVYSRIKFVNVFLCLQLAFVYS